VIAVEWRQGPPSEDAMARLKQHDYRQTKMLPVSFDRQVLAGTFEQARSQLGDQQIEITSSRDTVSQTQTPTAALTV
jgi:hypothetical protein